MLLWIGNLIKEKFFLRFVGVIRLVRKVGFLVEVSIELMIKSNTCMINNFIIGFFLRVVTGVALIDVTGVFSNF